MAFLDLSKRQIVSNICCSFFVQKCIPAKDQGEMSAKNTGKNINYTLMMKLGHSSSSWIDKLSTILAKHSFSVLNLRLNVIHFILHFVKTP